MDILTLEGIKLLESFVYFFAERSPGPAAYYVQSTKTEIPVTFANRPAKSFFEDNTGEKFTPSRLCPLW